MYRGVASKCPYPAYQLTLEGVGITYGDKGTTRA